jgi:hypothetical protein
MKNTYSVKVHVGNWVEEAACVACGLLFSRRAVAGGAALWLVPLRVIETRRLALRRCSSARCTSPNDFLCGCVDQAPLCSRPFPSLLPFVSPSPRSSSSQRHAARGGARARAAAHARHDGDALRLCAAAARPAPRAASLAPPRHARRARVGFRVRASPVRRYHTLPCIVIIQGGYPQRRP